MFSIYICTLQSRTWFDRGLISLPFTLRNLLTPLVFWDLKSSITLSVVKLIVKFLYPLSQGVDCRVRKSDRMWTNSKHYTKQTNDPPTGPSVNTYVSLPAPSRGDIIVFTFSACLTACPSVGPQFSSGFHPKSKCCFRCFLFVIVVLKKGFNSSVNV